MSPVEPKLVIIGIVSLSITMIFQIVGLPIIYSLIAQLVVLIIFCIQYRQTLSPQSRDDSHPMGRDSEKVATTLNYPSPEIEAALSQIYAELDITLSVERDVINNEIERVTNLIQGAVKGMSSSFHRMKSFTDKQQKMLKDLVTITMAKTEYDARTENASTEKLVSTVNINKMNDTIETLALMNDEIDQSLNWAVRSLQFEDLATQTLQSMSDNISQFSAISVELNLLATGKHSIEFQLEQIRQVCGIARVNTSKNHTHRSVSQHSMDEGEIELF